ncbi:sigma-70 family RNA polymerase sigma factor [Catellatospora sp. NPDC049609]|uniref:RNA polymerase sigma factor n=1 Tax=Catellatospora sp. NPDC049609 TaxID=3155505 RepID=UPI00344483C6
MQPDDAAARARFEALFDAHYAELTRFASRRVGADTAGDIVSGTFLIAWRRLAEVPDAHPRAWLYAVARHVIANELRSRERRNRLAAKAGVADDTVTEDHAGQVGEQLRVRAALAALSPADQEVLRLTAWDGLDVAEAAIVLGCGRTALKVRLHRARRRFAARLRAAEDTDVSAARRGPLPTILPEGNLR